MLICRQKLNQPNKPLSQLRRSNRPDSCMLTTIVAISKAIITGINQCEEEFFTEVGTDKLLSVDSHIACSRGL